jgi:hypothetical protein
MFYWNYRGIYVVLTDAEEFAALEEVVDQPEDLLAYDVWPDTRRKYEKRIAAYLKRHFNADPEAFRRKYVFRSYYDNDARQLFPTFLDAYGRATRNATFGKWGGDPLLDDAVEGMIQAQTEKIYYVTLLSRVWYLPMRFQATGRISFPAASIENLAGEVCNFVVMTDAFSIRFGRNFIRLSLH